MTSESDAGEVGASMPAASSQPAYVRAHPQYGTIVCTEHRTAYTPTNIMNHLVNDHKASQTVRQATQRYINSQNIQTVVTEPLDHSAPIPGLQIFPGWQCNINRCSLLSQHAPTIGKHCSKVHGLNSKRRRDEMGAVVQVSIQRWFAKSNKYWVVDPRSASQPSLTTPHSVHSHSTLAHFTVGPSISAAPSSPLPSTLLASSPPPARPTPFVDVLTRLSQQVRDEEQSRRRMYHETEHPSELSPWLRRCGYELHLRGVDKDVLEPLLRLPRRATESPQLFYILQSVARVLQASYQEVFRLHHIPALRLNSFEPSRMSNDPFTVLQNAESFRRYTSHFQGMVCYFYRMGQASPVARPLFETTSQQDSVLDELTTTVDDLMAYASSDDSVGEEEQDENTPDPERLRMEAQVDTYTLQLLVALLQHPTRDSPFQSVISSFCAVASWSFRSGSWLPITGATSILSQTIYCGQLVLLAEALRTVTDEHSLLERLAPLCDQWCHNMAFGPLGDLLRLRPYGMAIGLNTVAIARVRWRSDQETLMYRDITYRISDLATEIDLCLTQARLILHDDLCLRLDDIPCFDLAELEDNWDDDAPGASFLSDPRNAGHLDNHVMWLRDRVRAHATLFDIVAQPSSSLDVMDDQIRSRFASEYETSVQRFLGYMSILIHKGSGQPARGPEFLGLRWQNLWRGGVKRNLFVHDGHLLFLLRYHKTQHRTHASQYPVRFLLPDVAQLLVQYLVLILPFRAILSKGQAIPAQVSEYLWHRGDKIWTAEHFSDLVRDVAEQAHGVAVSLSSWRQIAVAIAMKKFSGMRYEADLDMPTDETDDLGGLSILDSWGGAMADVFHHQAAHSVRTGNQSYGGTINFDHGLTDAGLHEYFRASRLWHQLCQPVTIPSVAGHRRQASRELTPAVHTPLRRRLAHRDRPGRHTLRWGTEQVQFALRQLFPHTPNVRFRSAEQEQLVEAIVTGCPEVVGVLGTGRGKTLAFLLPACLPRAGTTVVVVPLVALRSDLIRRCEEAGLSYTVWDRTTDQHRLIGTPLLFVSIEASVRQRFRAFLGQLDAVSALDRIVFDEAHLILTAASYRPKMGLVYHLRSLHCQVVFLTATLPPVMQPQFEARLLLKQPRVVRSQSFRPDITYRLRVSSHANLIEYVARSVLKQLQHHAGDPDSRMLLYTTTRAAADDLSTRLACPRYYSDSGDADEKAQAVQTWQSGVSKVLVATSAFGVGIDFPTVRQVLHVGAPTDMIGFAQEVGRLGRDGQGGISRVIVPRGWQAPSLPSVVDQRRSAASEMAMLTYLGENRCLSAVVSRFLDGPEHMQYCSNPDRDFQCTRCVQQGLFRPSVEHDATVWWDIHRGEGQEYESSDHAGSDDTVTIPTSPPELGFQDGSQRLRDRVRETALARQRYRDGLQLLQGRCMLCMVLGYEQVAPSAQLHRLDQCRHIQRPAFFRAKGQAMERHRARGGWMQPYVACFRCGQPQDICPVTTSSSRPPCVYRDLVFPATWALFYRERCWGRTLGELSGTPSRIWQHEERWMDWLGTECDLYGMRASQAARMMDMIIRLELAGVLPGIPV